MALPDFETIASLEHKMKRPRSSDYLNIRDARLAVQIDGERRRVPH